jgi:hypothetical protein
MKVLTKLYEVDTIHCTTSDSLKLWFELMLHFLPWVSLSLCWDNAEHRDSRVCLQCLLGFVWKASPLSQRNSVAWLGLGWLEWGYAWQGTNRQRNSHLARVQLVSRRGACVQKLFPSLSANGKKPKLLGNFPSCLELCTEPAHVQKMSAGKFELTMQKLKLHVNKTLNTTN